MCVCGGGGAWEGKLYDAQNLAELGENPIMTIYPAEDDKRDAV